MAMKERSECKIIDWRTGLDHSIAERTRLRSFIMRGKKKRSKERRPRACGAGSPDAERTLALRENPCQKKHKEKIPLKNLRRRKGPDLVVLLGGFCGGGERVSTLRVNAKNTPSEQKGSTIKGAKKKTNNEKGRA